MLRDLLVGATVPLLVIVGAPAAAGATPVTSAATPVTSAATPPAAPAWGDVHISTVPALAGVHLTVAGAPVITGPDGRATAQVTNLDTMTRQVRLAETTAGADTVALTTVLGNPSPRGSRSVTVGLNVTTPVRISVAAGTAGVEPSTVRTVRLHSSNGSTVSIDPNAGVAVPLLAVRTWLQHGRLVAQRIGWTVDSISAGPGVAVTASRESFEPARSSAWVLTLRPVAGSVSVTTVPATAGVHLSVGGASLTTGLDGTGSVSVADLNDVAHTVRLDDATAGDAVVALHRVDTIAAHRTHARALVVALQVSRPVTLAFTDPAGAPVPAGRIDSVTLHGDGRQVVLRGAELTAPVDLVSTIPSLVHGRWRVRPVIYSVAEVHLAGSNAVFAGRERFAPLNSRTWHISLALYTATIRVADALFGTSVTTTAHLTAQDGSITEVDIPRTGVSLPSTVRGMYTLTIDSAVVGGTNRIRVSGDTAADIRIITLADVAIVIGTVVVLAAALLLLGAWIARRDGARRRIALRPRQSASQHPRLWSPRPAWSRHVWAFFVVLLMGVSVAVSTLVSSPSASGAPSTAASPAYVYFYQWYTDSSWRRAKEDTPLIGPYSSASPAVLGTQIAEIKAAGITGIFTSWKDTAQLNDNLQMLVDQAAPAELDVGIVYEALDFDRRPLPIDTVRSDMRYLIDRWGADLMSPYFGAPVIIWTGTNEYTPEQVRSVHDELAGRALLLAASKSVADYNAVADFVDGEAYYWSSSNPTSPNTAKKLADMGAAVRAHHGIWIAPAAAGFDGRTLGHTRVIPRNNGQSLVQSLKVAYASDPTAVGVISWNEWSENTYIEPGQRYGSTELDALTKYLRDIRAGAASTSASSHAGLSQPGSLLPRTGDAAPGDAPMTGSESPSTSPTASARPRPGDAAQRQAISAVTSEAGGAVADGGVLSTDRRASRYRWEWVAAGVAPLALAGLLVTVRGRRRARLPDHS